MIEVLLLAGWAFEAAAGGRKAAEAEANIALEALIADGLGYRLDSVRGRLFDPVEVVNVLKWMGLTGQSRIWADRYVETGRKLVRTLANAVEASAANTGPATLRFGVEIERTFNLREFGEGARLRLRMPVPLKSPDIEDLTVIPSIPESLGAEVSLRDDSLEVRCRRPVTGEATLGVRMDFTTQTSAATEVQRLSAEDCALYLRPGEGLVQVTPAVEALAAALVGSAKSPQAAVAAFWDHMLDALICGALRYSDFESRPPVDWVLDAGWCDCQVGSALLVSLCRARGIPARLVGGHLLYQLAPTNHFWSEIWLEGEGWKPYDLLCWDLSAGGQDPAWRGVFAGRLDPRLVTQRPPLAFTGAMSVRLPPLWQMTQIGGEPGVLVTYRDAPSGALVFRDLITVVTPPAPSFSGGNARQVTNGA